MSSYKLLIVESPAKAKTISKYLGRGYKVEASQGHVRDLPKSQLGVDVDNNFEPKYITIRGRGDILNRIRKEAKGASRIFLATDPDREGEAISWHLAEMLGIDPDENCRIEFNEVTSKAVKAAVKTPRPLNMNLINAQQARRVLDRLVGYKISPLLWSKVRKGLSGGRVQSVAAAMICQREREIEAFEAEEYWTINAEFQSGKQRFSARFINGDAENKALTGKDAADDIMGRIENAGFTVDSVKKAERKKYPAPPFTTSNLQQEASRKLNFTAIKTMQIAQQLYEGVEIEGMGSLGLVSYIRTDSTRISDDALSQLRQAIEDRFGKDYLPETPNVYKSRKNAQDAHEAIRPTDALLRPEKLKGLITNDQYKLYKLIYDRFFASQMTPAVYDTLTADLKTKDSITFRHTSQKLRFAGFTAVYEESIDDEAVETDSRMPNLSEGESVSLISATPEQHFTQPPARYTEASLVKALEEKGIGRPSTYAPTIATIIQRGYISREKKRLFPTELGNVVNDMMTRSFPEIVDIQFTAEMESKLDAVEAGEAEWHKVLTDFYGPFEKTLQKAESTIEKVKVEDEVSDVPCEKCGAMMVYKMGKFGRFLACPRFPECRHTQAILKTINVPCPDCGGLLIERMSRKGRKFYGCEKYPECQFVSWDMPVKDLCPNCGGRMVQKRSHKGELTHVCVNEQCQTRVKVENTNKDDDNE
ncbi:MAG: type I DNA topoisomerase [Clostridia bacterium]|nr:type I DNA topoisomerase [Clostridia bacterium]